MKAPPGPILFCYDDSPVYGGHEVMAVSGVAGILAHASQPQVVFACHPNNQKLRDALGALSESYGGRLRIEPLAVELGRAPWVRHWGAGRQLRQLRELIQKSGAKRTLAMQGDVAASTALFWAAAPLGLPRLSYLAVPHTLVQMGAKLPVFRDRLNAPLLRLPTAWITLSPAMEKILRQRGARQPVRLVANGIDLPRAAPIPRAEARRSLSLPEDGLVVGLLARTEFKHKGHLLLLEALARPELAEAWAVIGGDGPDQERLRAELKRRGLAERVRLLGWVGQPTAFHAAIDVLAIPSRYEGVPLVMLEALGRSRPVVGSDRDGMADWLPPAWRFPYPDSAALARAIVTAVAAPAHERETLRAKVAQHTGAAFRQAFAAATIESPWWLAKPGAKAP